MLDTNIVSHIVKQHNAVIRRAVSAPIDQLCVSAITQGELLFGLARRPEATRLNAGVREFIRRVDVLPWDRHVAAAYGDLRADLQRGGRELAPLDLLIAAHALSAGAVLVTNDQAFAQVAGLAVEDWTIPARQ
jgi:tRNA(fMet)-specific endonuclease VapC